MISINLEISRAPHQGEKPTREAYKKQVATIVELLMARDFKTSSLNIDMRGTIAAKFDDPLELATFFMSLSRSDQDIGNRHFAIKITSLEGEPSVTHSEIVKILELLFERDFDRSSLKVNIGSRMPFNSENRGRSFQAVFLDPVEAATFLFAIGEIA